MNKTLTTEYLFNIFKHAVEKKKNLSSFFDDLFKEENFINMVLTKPFDIEPIIRIIDDSKTSRTMPSINQIRYLSFLIAEFIERTSLNIKYIPKYIDVNDILNEFIYLHLQDIDNVIFYLFTSYNTKYKLRKASCKVLLNEEKVLENFKRLYPIKRFDSFRLIYDSKLSKRIYVNDYSEVLFFYAENDGLFSDEYFKQKYLIGNKVYCFSKNVNIRQYYSRIYLFLVGFDRIKLFEPNGISYSFVLSN